MTRERGGGLQAEGISRQILRVLSPRWARGDPGADRNRGGGGGGRLPEGRARGGRRNRDLVLRSVRGASAACAWGRRGLPVGQRVPCPVAGPLELENVSQKLLPTSPTPTDTSPTLLVDSA